MAVGLFKSAAAQVCLFLRHSWIHSAGLGYVSARLGRKHCVCLPGLRMSVSHLELILEEISSPNKGAPPLRA